MAVGTTDSLVAERYRVKKALGRGGMATVYLAEDERLDREVAVKRLHADSAEDVEIRFVREAKLGASLNHPNLVWVFDILTEDEGLVIVMEYVDGPHLGQELSDGPLEPRRAVEVLAATASALEYAHEHGVVHRDVKPANVLLGRDGTIKLADLGIATAADITRITRSDVALGTASYMAPEQLEGDRVTAATDVYALATVAFEMLSGERARSGRSPMEVAHAVSSEPPPDLRQVWPDAPGGAAAVLSSAMARNPADRPGSACDFVSDLARALGEEATARVQLEAARAATTAAPAAEPEPEPVPTPAPAPARFGRRGLYQAPPKRRGLALGLLAGALAVLAVIAVAVLLAGGDDDSSRSSSPAPEPRQRTQQEQQGASGDQGASEQPGPAASQQPAPAGVPQASGKGGAATGARLNQEGYRTLQGGNAKAAVPTLRRAVEAFPAGTKDVQYAYALYNLGRALRLSGDADGAVAVLERRMQIPNQRSTVQKELDAARRDAG